MAHPLYNAMTPMPEFGPGVLQSAYNGSLYEDVRSPEEIEAAKRAAAWEANRRRELQEAAARQQAAVLANAKPSDPNPATRLNPIVSSGSAPNRPALSIFGDNGAISVAGQGFTLVDPLMQTGNSPMTQIGGNQPQALPQPFQLGRGAPPVSTTPVVGNQPLVPPTPTGLAQQAWPKPTPLGGWNSFAQRAARGVSLSPAPAPASIPRPAPPTSLLPFQQRSIPNGFMGRTPRYGY